MATTDTATRTVTVEITGMHCASCGILVDDCLEDVEGVVTSQTSTKTEPVRRRRHRRRSPTPTSWPRSPRPATPAPSSAGTP